MAYGAGCRLFSDGQLREWSRLCGGASVDSPLARQAFAGEARRRADEARRWVVEVGVDRLLPDPDALRQPTDTHNANADAAPEVEEWINEHLCSLDIIRSLVDVTAVSDAVERRVAGPARARLEFSAPPPPALMERVGAWHTAAIVEAFQSFGSSCESAADAIAQSLAGVAARVSSSAADADERARALLVRHLDERQRRQYEAAGCFTVGGRWLVVSRQDYNVVDLMTYEPVSYCANLGPVPLADSLLAQKLALESWPRSFLRRANKMSGFLFGSLEALNEQWLGPLKAQGLLSDEESAAPDRWMKRRDTRAADRADTWREFMTWGA